RSPLDLHDALPIYACVTSSNALHRATRRAHVLGGTELFDRFEREDATIGASHKVAAVALAQLQPVRLVLVVKQPAGQPAIRVGEQPVLLKALITRIDHSI